MSAGSPSPFNLEHLKKDAKRRLRACLAGDPDAIAFVRDRLAGMRRHDAAAVARTVRLADIHQALAADRGFASWADLTRLGDPAARLLVAIRGHHVATLRRGLAEFHDAAESNVFAASALGHAVALRRLVRDHPAQAIATRDGWTPLDYVCSSPLARFSTRHATGLRECAEILLAAGADPTTSVSDARSGGKRLPAIVRALLAGNTALMGILKRGGAEEPHEVLRRELLDGATGDAAALQHLFRDYFRRPDVREHMQQRIEEFKADGTPRALVPVDPRDAQTLHLPNLLNAQAHLWSALLVRGFDPAAQGATGRTVLHTLVTYAPASFVELLLERGVDATARDVDGQSVVAAAVRAGNFEVVDLLRARGVPDDATNEDRFVGRCLAGDAEAAQALAATLPSPLGLDRRNADELVRAAARGATTPVRLMLACGVPPDAVGEAGATALQMAAWRGQIAIVELLLAHGASPEARDEVYGETAREWAEHGASHAQGAAAECRQAAHMLAAAERHTS
jgi:ankyrin repeat protein